MGTLLLIGGGLALLYALAKRPAGEVAPQLAPEGRYIRINIPPIDIPFASQAEGESVLKKYMPSIRLTTAPMGWRLTFPPFHFDTAYGPIDISISPIQLPLIPQGQASGMVSSMKPRVQPMVSPPGVRLIFQEIRIPIG